MRYRTRGDSAEKLKQNLSLVDKTEKLSCRSFMVTYKCDADDASKDAPAC